MSRQEEAIKKTEGPCVILAGAGTGKTYTIVEKIKYLIHSKTYLPQKIVCLTFSNEAANSLSERVLRATSEEHQPIIRTFHSFCADLLKTHGEKIGISKNFRILLPDDGKIMLYKNLKLVPILCHKYIESIGIAKDLGISVSDLENYLARKNVPDTEAMESSLENLKFKMQITNYPKDQKNQLKEETEKLENLLKIKRFLQIWRAYEKLKEKRNLQDYSDLNKNALLLLKSFPEIAEDYDYVIVDEFQDTNKLQCDFLSKISPKKNITIVGDMNQSIYRFRGAYKNNLPNFKKEFGITDKDIFTLDKSYRSTNNILEVAHKLVEHNYSNKDECFKVLNYRNQEGDKVETYELKNSKEEGRKIIEIIKEEISKGTPLEEICIIFRTHQQTKLLKSYLENEGIPFSSITSKNLLKAEPVKKTTDYLTILHKLKTETKGGEQVWWDLFFSSDFSKEDKIGLSKFIKQNKESECLSKKIYEEISNSNLSEAGNMKIKLLISRIKRMLEHTELPIQELILKIYEISGFNSPESENYKENIPLLEKFRAIAEEFAEMDSPDLASFIHHLNIMNNLGISIETPRSDNGGVRIMTNHSTKGLEYQVVIVTNLAQKRFPIERINSSLIPPELSPEIAEKIAEIPENQVEEFIEQNEKENQLLEERRLCYVAFTRAKKRLVLTYAQEYGKRKHYPSQFLSEIDYRNNPKIDFIEDLSDSYKEPERRIIPGQNILSFINSAELEIQLEEPKVPEIRFSPSALQTFDDCQKRYEYKYVYNMPDPEPTSWDAIRLGSFIHEVLEKGVNSCYKTEKEFMDLAKSMQMQEEWNFIDLKEMNSIIKVFLHRNKDKYNARSRTEQVLTADLEGLKFIGFADRIDFSPEGIEIVDYKTGNSDIKPKYRNWQLGFYAIAAQKFGTPKRLTLDMLKKENSLEFEIDNKGNAKEIHSPRTNFNLNKVKQELVETAKEILEAYKSGFKVCPAEKNCPFCNDFLENQA